MKKNYYIVTSIIQIVLMIAAFASVPQIVSGQMKAMQELDAQFASMMAEYQEVINLQAQETEEQVDVPKEIVEETTEVPCNGEFEVLVPTNEGVFDELMNSIDMPSYYTRIYYMLAFVIIIFNVIILEIANRNHILRHRARVIAYSVITFLFGSSLSLPSALLALATMIVTACLKKTSEEDEPIKYEKVKPLELKKYITSDILKGILFVVVYALLHFGAQILIDRAFPEMPDIAFILTTILLDIIVFVLGLYLFKDEIKTGFDALKQNPGGYRNFIVKAVIVCYLCMIPLNLIRLFVTGNTFSENQNALNSAPTLYVFVLAVFWAPLVEELVFRGALRRLIKNNILFICVSGILFGLLHAVTEVGAFNIIITSLPYIAMGTCFAAAYEKSNNIWVNMLIHALNNLIAVTMSMLMFGF